MLFLDLETFEAALINMAAAQGMIMGMPAHGMSVREPLREGRELSLLLRPNDKVPIIGHQAIGEQPGRMRLQRLAEHALKGLVVAILLEQRQARNGSIENVIEVTSRRCTSNTGHAPTIQTHGAAGKERGLSSFLSLLLIVTHAHFGKIKNAHNPAMHISKNMKAL